MSSCRALGSSAGRSSLLTVMKGSLELLTQDVMDWMSVSPQNSYVEALIPSVMVFGGGAFVS